MEFKTIAEPTRLLVGDVVTVPAEPGARRKVRLSPSALSKHGVSMGFTRRSDNKPETVEILWTSKPERARAFWVGFVSLRHYYDERQRKYRNMVGNVGCGEPQPDVVRKAALYPLPSPSLDPKERLLASLYWCRDHKELVAEALVGHVTEGDVMVSYHGSFENTPDARTKEIYESQYGNPEKLCSRCLETFLPCSTYRDCSRTGDPKRLLSAEEINHAFLQSGCFEPDEHDECDNRIEVTAKFLQWSEANGVKYRRPDPEFAKRVSRYVASVLMEEFVRRQGAMLRSVAKYLTGLKSDVAAVKDRAKRGTATVRKTALVKREIARTFGPVA